VQVVFLRRARADLDRLRQFLAPHSEQLSQRAIDTLFAAAGSLHDLPERGRPAARPGYRNWSYRSVAALTLSDTASTISETRSWSFAFGMDANID